MTGHQQSRAASSAAGYAGDLSSRESWDQLAQDPAAQLIDVRTMAEWNFVGAPDLSSLGREVLFCEWQRFPAGPNPGFAQELAAALKQAGYRPGAALLFICRSGARSRSAAIAMTNAGFGPCFNVGDGFEGRLDPEGHRGRTEGWKAAGLPWIQS
jgi:rhodanese-related sulfurtransferase